MFLVTKSSPKTPAIPTVDLEIVDITPRIRRWSEVIDMDFPQMGEVTEEARTTSMALAARYDTDVRIATGRVYTTAEFEKLRAKEHPNIHRNVLSAVKDWFKKCLRSST